VQLLVMKAFQFAIRDYSRVRTIAPYVKGNPGIGTNVESGESLSENELQSCGETATNQQLLPAKRSGEFSNVAGVTLAKYFGYGVSTSMTIRM